MVNIVAKGEIACFKQFFFCHYVFKKPSAAEASESVYMRGKGLILSLIYIGFNISAADVFENIMWQNEQLLISFPTQFKNFINRDFFI